MIVEQNGIGPIGSRSIIVPICLNDLATASIAFKMVAKYSSEKEYTRKKT